MATHHLDITKEHCPMTFVKTKLKLAQIAEGDIPPLKAISHMLLLRSLQISSIRLTMASFKFITISYR